ncbi:MAG: site-2 protease family protein [Salinirussus sp.]
MRGYRIGSAFGIPIRLDITFLLVLPLFAWIIGAQVGRWADLVNGLWGAGFDAAMLNSGALPWVLGIIAALGLFIGVVLHELGHSLLAMRYGFPIESITLWLFGGVAQLEEMPEDWRQELVIALAGPAVSIVLGAASYVVFIVLPATTSVGLEATRFVLSYLAIMNISLAAFNLLPGFPMDGGRVLRALLARTRPYARATQIAAEVGKGFAILLGLFGLLAVFNPILIALAFFIYIGAAGEAQQTTMRAAFEGVVVEDIMTPADRIETVDASDSVADLIGLMFSERHTGYPVERNGEIIGLVTLEDARAVREVEREAFRVEEIMTTDVQTVSPETDVMTALETLENEDIGRLLVHDGEEFVGLLTRTDVMTALSIIKSSGRYGDAPTADEAPEIVRPGGSS